MRHGAFPSVVVVVLHNKNPPTPCVSLCRDITIFAIVPYHTWHMTGGVPGGVARFPTCLERKFNVLLTAPRGGKAPKKYALRAK